MLQLYGNPRSRAMRCLWMLEEIGKPYQLVEKTTRADDLQAAEYLRLIQMHEFRLGRWRSVLWKSMAINLYLAQKYDGPMHRPGPEVLGLAAQWSFWAVLVIEHLLLNFLEHRALLAEFARDPSVTERNELLLKKPLGVLNDALAARGYLAGNSFTVADLNVAGILVWGKMARMDLSAYPELTRWLDAAWPDRPMCACAIKLAANDAI